MKEFINDNWREFFGLNIENIIKQYENRNWPKIEKKPFTLADNFNTDSDKEEDLLDAFKTWSDNLPLLIIDNRYTNNFLNDLPNKKWLQNRNF